jgi:hypothetical protein
MQPHNNIPHCPHNFYNPPYEILVLVLASAKSSTPPPRPLRLVIGGGAGSTHFNHAVGDL